jgi:hypothetical protein
MPFYKMDTMKESDFMGLESDINIIDDVLLLLDFIVILKLEDNPIIGIIMIALLKLVTEDRTTRIALILLVIVLSTIPSE